jgi:2'-5' RNA ligase superfamily
VQSVELLLDPVSDAAVRAQWAVLGDAGLPSRQHHTGPTNAPHVTLALAGQTTPAAEQALAAVAACLPLPVRLGGLLVLGRRRLVVARLVVPSAELVALHAVAAHSWAGLPGVPDLVRPGQWTPHVTLARGLTTDQVAAAVQVLQADDRDDRGDLGGLVGEAVTLRRWDPVARKAWAVPGQVVDRPRDHGGD